MAYIFFPVETYFKNPNSKNKTKIKVAPMKAKGGNRAMGRWSHGPLVFACTLPSPDAKSFHAARTIPASPPFKTTSVAEYFQGKNVIRNESPRAYCLGTDESF